MKDFNKEIKKFQLLDKKRIDILKKDKKIVEEIFERLEKKTKKEFLFLVVNIKPDINKKFSSIHMKNKNINEFLKNYRLTNGFYQFLPSFYKNTELLKITNECRAITNEIIEYNTLLIRKQVGKQLSAYPYLKSYYDELYSGGIIGMIHAIYKYNPDLIIKNKLTQKENHVKFITYCYKWVTYYIHREMNDIIKTFNNELVDNESYFDSIITHECTYSNNLINELELEEIMNMEILDNFEKELLKLSLNETIDFSDISYTLNKIKEYISKNCNSKLLFQYLKGI